MTDTSVGLGHSLPSWIYPEVNTHNSFLYCLLNQTCTLLPCIIVNVNNTRLDTILELIGLKRRKADIFGKGPQIREKYRRWKFRQIKINKLKFGEEERLTKIWRYINGWDASVFLTFNLKVLIRKSVSLKLYFFYWTKSKIEYKI